MPKIDVVFYQEEVGSVPVLDWLDEIPGRGTEVPPRPQIALTLTYGRCIGYSPRRYGDPGPIPLFDLPKRDRQEWRPV